MSVSGFKLTIRMRSEAEANGIHQRRQSKHDLRLLPIDDLDGRAAAKLETANTSFGRTVVLTN